MESINNLEGHKLSGAAIRPTMSGGIVEKVRKLIKACRLHSAALVIAGAARMPFPLHESEEFQRKKRISEYDKILNMEYVSILWSAALKESWLTCSCTSLPSFLGDEVARDRREGAPIK